MWTLEDYWTQVGVLRGHSASSADFNWRATYNSVSICEHNFVMVIDGYKCCSLSLDQEWVRMCIKCSVADGQEVSVLP